MSHRRTCPLVEPVLTPSPSCSEGSNVAVFGCGAIGLGVIATSALVGASRIIAVDTNPGKESWARKFGATEFVNPAKLPEGTRIQDHLVEITDGGLDFTFDATGNVRPFSSLEALRVPISMIFLLRHAIRFMSCALRLKHAIRAGVSAPSLVSLLQARKSRLVRKCFQHQALVILCS